MSYLPDNIKELMRSNAYNNSNHPSHAATAGQVADYFNSKYSGSRMDATGRNITIRKVWVWHAEEDEKTCEKCEELSDQIFENQEDIPEHPYHPNCRCWIEEIELDDGDKPVVNDKQLKLVRRTMGEEGGYVDDLRLVDQPTNAGITAKALNDYNRDHPNYNFPKNIAHNAQLPGKKIEQKHISKLNLYSRDPDACVANSQNTKYHIKPGTQLVKKYKGREYIVTVIAPNQPDVTQFIYADATYKTLSSIATKICGHKVSGYDFFGLNKKVKHIKTA